MNGCYHCGELIPAGVQLSVMINDEPRQMCCHGCLAVAEFMADQSCLQFYQFRKDKLPNQQTQPMHQWQSMDEPSIVEQLTRSTEDQHRRVTIKVEDMYCQACGWLLNKALNNRDGIQTVNINAINKILHVTYDPTKVLLSEVFAHISQLGYRPSTMKHYGEDLNKERRGFWYGSTWEIDTKF